MSFPYQTVFDYFAKPLDGKELGTEVWRPAMFLVSVAENKVIAAKSYPVAEFFCSSDGKKVLGEVIRQMILHILPSDCLVLMSEAWIKSQSLESVKAHGIATDLERDPHATEAITVTIYGYGAEMRFGSLPISPGRIVTYRPLPDSPSRATGRLTPTPDHDIVGEASAQQDVASVMADHLIRRAQGKH